MRDFKGRYIRTPAPNLTEFSATKRFLILQLLPFPQEKSTIPPLDKILPTPMSAGTHTPFA